MADACPDHSTQSLVTVSPGSPSSLPLLLLSSFWGDFNSLVGNPSDTGCISDFLCAFCVRLSSFSHSRALFFFPATHSAEETKIRRSLCCENETDSDMGKLSKVGLRKQHRAGKGGWFTKMRKSVKKQLLFYETNSVCCTRVTTIQNLNLFTVFAVACKN